MKSIKLWRRKGIEAPSLRRFKLVRASLLTFIDLIKKGELLETYEVGGARIYIYEFEGMGYYIIEEPELDEEEEKLYELLMDSLYFTVKPVGIENPIEYIKNHIFETSKKLGIKELVEKSFDKLMYYIVRDVLGYGPLDVLIKDPRIEDISLEGVGKPIRVFHRDYSYLDWLMTNLIFDEEEYLDGLITMIAHKSKKHVSTAFPVAEGALPEKHRVSITFSREITPFGSSITIRKFREEPLTITHLIRFGTISSLMAAYWWILLENKGSIFIVGEMASGKSVHPKSTLMVLMNNIPKVLTIEELWSVLRNRAPIIKRGGIEYIELSNIDIKVLAINKSKAIWARPRYIIRHKSPEKLVKIKLSSGREIIITQDHSLIVMDSSKRLRVTRPLDVRDDEYLIGISSIEIPKVNKNVVMKLLVELLNKQGISLYKKNSKLESYRAINEHNELYIVDKDVDIYIPLESLLRPEFGYLLGFFVSHSHSYDVSILEIEKHELRQHLEQLLMDLGFRYSINTLKSLNNMISKLFKVFLVVNDSNKRLPDITWTMGKEWIASLLLGIIDSNSYVDKDCIKIELRGNEFLHELLYAFSILNIYPFIEVKNGNSHDKYILSIPQHCIEKFNKYLPETLRSRISKLINERNICKSLDNDNEIVLEKVKSIEVVESDVDYVYDIEVPYLENFEVNTVFVHNTTLLNALASMLPPSWKIVTIEDTPELRLPHIGWKPLVARHVYSLAEAKTEIGLFDLVKLSLRERAQFIIVGEIRGEEAYVFVQALASVTGDTPVLIRNGNTITLIPIRELVDKYYKPNEERIAKKVQGLEILTLNTKGEITWAPIQYVLRHRANEIYRIRYRGGEIRATVSHSVFILDKDTLEIKTKPVCELKTDDLLISFILKSNDKKHPKRINLIEILRNEEDVEIVGKENERFKLRKLKINESLSNSEKVKVCINDSCLPTSLIVDNDLAFLLGTYLAKGYIESGKICFKSNKMNNIMRKVINIMKNKFNIEPQNRDEDEHTYYEFYHPLLAMVLEKLIGRDLEDKRIPEFLWNSSIDIAKAFLEGCSISVVENRSYAIYSTKSKKLAEQLLWFSRLHGMYSYISKREKGGNTEYLVHILFKPKHGRVYFHELVPISIIKNVVEKVGIKYIPSNHQRILERNKYVTKRKAREILSWLEKILSNSDENAKSILNRLKIVLSDRITLLSIKEIKKESYDGFVYDVSVPGTEAFFGGETPILLHNTGHGGGCTFHGDSIESMVMRLTTPPINVPISFLPLISNVVITRFIRIPGKKPMRRVVEVNEIIGVKSEREVDYRTIFSWSPEDDRHIPDDVDEVIKKSEKLEKVARLIGWTKDMLAKDLEYRKKFLEDLVEKGIFRYSDVVEYIKKFYKERRVGIR